MPTDLVRQNTQTKPRILVSANIRGFVFVKMAYKGCERRTQNAMAKVSFNSAGDLLAAYLSGEIDHHSAQMLRQLIDAEISARMPSQLVLDFGDVSFMDSSGIGLILGRAKQMQAMEGKVTVQKAPEQIKKMLDLAGVEYK